MCVYRNGEKNFEFKFSLGTNNIELKLKCSSFLGAQIKIKNGFSFKFFYF